MNFSEVSIPLEAVQTGFTVGGRLIVHGVDLTPERGMVTGLIGPNGAGKSTLLRMMAGLLAPTNGQVVLHGDNLAELRPMHIARRLAYMAQHPPTDQGFTALDMVVMGRYAHDPGWKERPEDVSAALDALRQTGSEHLAKQAYGTLSGGEKQRVILARALVQETDVLLLDEPTASLDLRYQLAVFDLVRRFTRERNLATVAVVHDLSLAARYCEQLCLLHEGRIVAVGSPEEVLQPDNLRTVFEVEAVVERHPRLGLMQVIPVSGALSAEEGARDISMKEHSV